MHQLQKGHWLHYHLPAKFSVVTSLQFYWYYYFERGFLNLPETPSLRPWMQQLQGEALASSVQFLIQAPLKNNLGAERRFLFSLVPRSLPATILLKALKINFHAFNKTAPSSGLRMRLIKKCLSVLELFLRAPILENIYTVTHYIINQKYHAIGMCTSNASDVHMYIGNCRLM